MPCPATKLFRTTLTTEQTIGAMLAINYCSAEGIGEPRFNIYPPHEAFDWLHDNASSRWSICDTGLFRSYTEAASGRNGRVIACLFAKEDDAVAFRLAFPEITHSIEPGWRHDLEDTHTRALPNTTVSFTRKALVRRDDVICDTSASEMITIQLPYRGSITASASALSDLVWGYSDPQPIATEPSQNHQIPARTTNSRKSIMTEAFDQSREYVAHHDSYLDAVVSLIDLARRRHYADGVDLQAVVSEAATGQIRLRVNLPDVDPDRSFTLNGASLR